MGDFNSQACESNRITTSVPVEFSTDGSFLETWTEEPLPIDMKYNAGHKLAVVMYSLLMTVSAIGNLSVFTALVR